MVATMHQSMEDPFEGAAGWMREAYEEVLGAYEELFLREPPNKAQVQAWVRSWLLGEAPEAPPQAPPQAPPEDPPKTVWRTVPGLPNFPYRVVQGASSVPQEKKPMFDYEEMARKRAEETLAQKREDLERSGTPGDHDIPARLVSPRISGNTDGLIRLIAKVGRGEVGGAEDGADEERDDGEDLG